MNMGIAIREKIKMIKKTGEDDPRRITHSLKVGVSITLVSLLYYFRPLYEGFGQAGMWAILTVVVVFEFTAGGTLSKSINRGFATLMAGALGVGAEYLAELTGKDGEPIVLGFLVFFLASSCTFMRFLPNVKKKYDYGVMIFILTFALVAVSGCRIDQILQLAHQRLSTILIGGATCIVISVFLCPVWAGQDLHNLIAGNIEKLASFLEGYGEEFLTIPGDEESGRCCTEKEEKPFLHIYESVLHSKPTEESLTNFAWWEPCHGRFRFRHPWDLYLKIGTLARECAYLIQTINASADSISQTNMRGANFLVKIQESCLKMCTESSLALRELSTSIKSMTIPSPVGINGCKEAGERLRTVMGETSLLPENVDLKDIMQLLVVSSVLIDIGDCIEKISIAVNELSTKAHFKKPESKLEDKAKRFTLFRVFHQGSSVKPSVDVC